MSNERISKGPPALEGEERRYRDLDGRLFAIARERLWWWQPDCRAWADMGLALPHHYQIAALTAELAAYRERRDEGEMALRVLAEYSALTAGSGASSDADEWIEFAKATAAARVRAAQERACRATAATATTATSAREDV